MTHLEKIAGLISAIAAVVTVLGIGLGMLIRITSRWSRIEERLQALVDRVTEAITGVRDENSRLERRVDRNEARLDRHEEFHAASERELRP